MKIRTQFILSTLLLGSFLLLVSASEIITDQWIQRLNRQEELAAQIEREAYELGYLANDYLLYREGQQAERWESKFASFSEHLSNMQVDRPEQQALLANIKTNQQRLRAVFTEVRTSIESAPQAQQALFDTSFMQVSWSRLEVQNQGLIFDASRLEGLLRAQEDLLRRVTRLLSFLLIVILSVFLLVTYMLIFRRTLQAITELQAGARIIGSGNLEYAIAVKNKDEIGELSLGFNQMTASLKEVTASKADLEREIAERAQAEEALRLSEKKFALAFANNPAAISLTRLDDGVFQDVNDTWQALTGYSHKEAIGFSARKLPIWPTAGEAARFVQELREKGGLHWREQEFRKKSGEVFVAQLSAQLLPIQGELMILSTLVDITKRKQAEDALRQSEARFRLALTHAPVSVATQDRDLVYTWAYNQRTRRPEEIIAKTDIDLFPSEAAHLTDLKRRVLETGENISEQLWITSNKQRLFLDLFIEPLRNEKGEIVGLGIATVDLTQLKLAEDSLRQKEALLQAVLDHVPDAIYLKDRDSRLLLANPATLAVIGKPAEAVLGKTDDEYYDDPATGRAIMENDRRIMNTGQMETVEERVYGPEGTRVYLSSKAPYYDGEGQIIGLIGTAHEITERVQAEQRIAAHNSEIQAANKELNAARLAALNLIEDTLRAQEELQKANARLRESEKRLNRAQEIAHLGSWELDLVKNQLSWSDEVYRIFGLQPQEFGATYEAFLESVHPEDRAAVDEAYSGSIREGKDSYEIEHRMVKRSSCEIRFVHEKCEHLRNEAGQIVRSVGMVHDITERKRAEEALQQSEAMLRAVLDQMPSGVTVRDALTGAIVLANARGREIMGTLADIPEQFEAYRGFHPDDRPYRNEEWPGHRSMATGEVVIAEEIKCERSDHTRFTISVSSIPIRDSQGKIILSVVVFDDVTERKRAEEALRAAHDELELRVQERTKELEIANQELLYEIYEREEAERQLRVQTTAMQAAANGIIITNREGEILWSNPALTRMTGYTEDDLIGENTRLFKSGKHPAEFYRQMWVTILAREVWRGEMTNRRKDGSLYVEEQTITPLVNENGEISHFIAIKQDVTARKQAEAELEQRNLELEAISATERKQRQLAETLCASAQALAQTLDLDIVLRTLLKHVRSLVQADTASVILLEGEACLVVRAVDGLGQAIDMDQILPYRIEGEENLYYQKLISTQKSLLIPDIAVLPDWEVLPGMEQMRNYLFTPILLEGKIVGAVGLGQTGVNYFTEEHVQWAEALVGQAAVAVQNAWLFEQVRASTERFQSLSHRLVDIQESERQYIARELHDEAGQALTSLMLDLRLLEKRASQPEMVIKTVAEMEVTLNSVLENLHRLAMALRPASLDHLGLVSALRQHVESTGGKFGLKTQFSAIGISGRLPSNMEIVLYRIVQEALTNVIRHAHASQVDVILQRRGDKLILLIEDDGIGFDTEAATPAGHLGLDGMRERAQMIGGVLVVESRPGGGTTIVVEVNDVDPVADRR